MNDGIPRRTKHKTCRRFNEPGHAHALTFSCFQGRPFLSKDRTRQWFVNSLDAARRRLAFDVWAYVIMPNHCHVLVWPRSPIYSISEILTSIKLPVARRAVAWVKQNSPDNLQLMRDNQPSGAAVHRFWQRGGGFDQNLVEEKLIYATIDYLHLNPVRRGLVERAEDWKWSSAGYFAGAADVPLKPDSGSLPTPVDET